MTAEIEPSARFVHIESGRSIYIQSLHQRAFLASGTAFVVQSLRGPLLLTNRHNVTGRSNTTNELLSPTGGVPNELAILHHHISKLGAWISKIEPLYHGDKPRWLEHPLLGSTVDVVGLPLTDLSEVTLFPYPPEREAIRIFAGPADPVSVIGFPFGISAGGSFAIWATGFMATEPSIDFDGLPAFLIDCRARPGQSGSPVVAFRRGSYALDDGSTVLGAGTASRLLGIYSGRINDQSDLGIVWKASVVTDIIAAWESGSGPQINPTNSCPEAQT